MLDSSVLRKRPVIGGWFQSICSLICAYNPQHSVSKVNGSGIFSGQLAHPRAFLSGTPAILINPNISEPFHHWCPNDLFSLPSDRWGSHSPEAQQLPLSPPEPGRLNMLTKNKEKVPRIKKLLCNRSCPFSSELFYITLVSKICKKKCVVSVPSRPHEELKSPPGEFWDLTLLRHVQKTKQVSRFHHVWCQPLHILLPKKKASLLVHSCHLGKKQDVYCLIVFFICPSEYGCALSHEGQCCRLTLLYGSVAGFCWVKSLAYQWFGTSRNYCR